MDKTRRMPAGAGRKVAIGGGAILGLYLAACGAIGLFQDRFVYPGAGRKRQVAGHGWTRITYEVEEAGEVEGFHWPAEPGKPTIMYLHGNGSGLSDVANAVKTYIDHGYGILSPEYPGYWGNPGKPRERLLAAAAREGMEWLEEQGTHRTEVIIIGNSIGSGPAIKTAVNGARALILISGVAHMKDLARLHFGYLPSLFLRDPYHNEAVVSAVNRPVLVVHGTLDRLVPVEQGRRLAAAAQTTYADQATYIEVVGEHDLTYRDDIQRQVLAWMEALPATEELEQPLSAAA